MIVEVLHKNGADVNAQDHNGCTPLMIAIMHNLIDISYYLLHHGANLNLRNRVIAYLLKLLAFYLYLGDVQCASVGHSLWQRRYRAYDDEARRRYFRPHGERQYSFVLCLEERLAECRISVHTARIQR